MVCVGVGRVHLNVRAYVQAAKVWWSVVVSGAFLSLRISRAKIMHTKIMHAQITRAQSLAQIHILQIINAGQKIALQSHAQWRRALKS